MKWLVILLLLANVVAFGVQYNEELNLKTREVTAAKNTKLPPGTPT